MEETKCSNQEVQGYASNYYITLLSGEIIEMPCLKSEDITETRDGNTFICLESATYIDRLYQAFKNKELVQFIRKESIHKVITNGEEVNREFSYSHYFKISEFTTRLDNDCPATYNITFETV
jgi:hypothetical protein